MRTQTIRWFAALLAVAALLPACAKKVPARGSDEWKRQLQAGEVFIETSTVPGTDLKLGSATGLVDAPIDIVWELFKDAGQWSQFLWNMKESREHPPSGENRIMEVVIEPPDIAVGFNDIRFKAEVNETINYDTGIWRADYNAIEGNIRRVYGAWQLESFGPDKTLITFSSFNDFGYPAALNAGVNYFTEMFLNQWSHDIRERLKDPAVRQDLEQRAMARRKRSFEGGPAVQNVDDFVR